jgi:hypothetical protein
MDVVLCLWQVDERKAPECHRSPVPHKRYHKRKGLGTG